jgi:hypothetical protein
VDSLDLMHSPAALQIPEMAEDRSRSPKHCVAPATDLLILLLVFAAIPAFAIGKKNHVAYGEGLIINIPLPESEVERVVADIAANGIIRGTKEYNKDEFVSGAQPAATSTAFPEWKQSGKVFYKVRTEALDPRGFKDSNDIGTLAVRYVVQPQGEKNTVLRIDALFKEDFKHTVHLSDGSVESNEYRDIQDHLDFLELMKKEDAEAAAKVNRDRQEQLARKQNAGAPATSPVAAPAESSSRNEPQTMGNSVTSPAGVQPAPSSPAPVAAAPPSVPASKSSHAVKAAKVTPAAAAPLPVPQPATPAVETASVATPPPITEPPVSEEPAQPPQTLEQRVKKLRSEVERAVKSPGAPLKSAPFHTALTLQSLGTGAQVLILISTPYWYGVETHEGQHGWIMRDELEQP